MIALNEHLFLLQIIDLLANYSEKSSLMVGLVDMAPYSVQITSLFLQKAKMFWCM